MKKRFHRPTSNVQFLGIFLAIVILFSSISLTVKFFVLMMNSSFKTDSFNVLIIDEDVHLMHIDKQTQRLSVLTLKDSRNAFLNKSRLESAFFLKIPVDAIATYPKGQFKKIPQDYLTFKNVLASLFNSNNAVYKGLNAADILKIYIAARSIESDNRTYVSETANYSRKDPKDISSLLENAFQDRIIFNEKASIEIVNATNVTGFGTKLGQLLENAGYNVIAIRNGDARNSKIVSRISEPNETLKYISRFFGFPVTRDNQAPVADITIILGEDLIKK